MRKLNNQIIEEMSEAPEAAVPGPGVGGPQQPPQQPDISDVIMLVFQFVAHKSEFNGTPVCPLDDAIRRVLMFYRDVSLTYEVIVDLATTILTILNAIERAQTPEIRRAIMGPNILEAFGELLRQNLPEELHVHVGPLAEGFTRGLETQNWTNLPLVDLLNVAGGAECPLGNMFADFMGRAATGDQQNAAQTAGNHTPPERPPEEQEEEEEGSSSAAMTMTM